MYSQRVFSHRNWAQFTPKHNKLDEEEDELEKQYLFLYWIGRTPATTINTV